MSGFRARTGQAAFSPTEVLAEATVHLMNPTPASTGGCYIRVSANLANTIGPTLVIP